MTFANLVVGYSLCRQLMVIRQESDVKIDVYAFGKNVKKS
ncbi:hypothetical protein HMPREF0819_0070 [Streptococcus equinus ATCC 9812]|uniref:Uncharacterized protein n=1 Tax=Streptococcus equinus ATCC 9812 TaxID=525379 RepID=E8JM47_STREI|nr:hypothetical protein HMPREF0819_0070 [Streptococcus equinus ATCC 9812]